MRLYKEVALPVARSSIHVEFGVSGMPKFPHSLRLLVKRTTSDLESY